ncbi:hypothetical protein [Actinoplanes derwentensis]|uniref:Uncharacterized protein n=1 Tax=Actinoplanes derwentensis TaxID=113562 RepID=A0A1H1ZIR2_9ACTN|nr:hypothetical protein [Actinoplanes derwentensis]GID82461.1 hypothetical protein Ade03nite_13850 [Actinoplanes derwentensis]SDT33560.1 hypothetical protein SAMN04489716_3342 [Actinoplanes derwentensis]
MDPLEFAAPTSPPSPTPAPKRRYLYTADQVAAHLDAVGLREVSRMVRRPRAGERDDQATVLAQA